MHTTDQILPRDLTSHVVSPPTNLFSLEQPCDVARSRPIGPKKNSSASRGQNVPFDAVISAFYLFICGVGCLGQGKEGQREK